MTARSRVSALTAVLLVSLLAFAALACTVFLWEEGDRLDIRFVGWVHGGVPPWVVDAMQVLTYAGSFVFLGPLALMAALVLARRGRPGAAAFVVAAFVAGHIVTQVLKLAFHRARPEFEDPFVRLSTYAFPSGHALGATVTYGALAIAFASARPGRRGAVVALLAATVLLVAASRVILGVHYLLDVAAGIAGGVAVLSGLLLAFELAPRYRTRIAGFSRNEQPQGPRLDP